MDTLRCLNETEKPQTTKYGRLTDNLKAVDLLPSTVLALTTTAGVASGALGVLFLQQWL